MFASRSWATKVIIRGQKEIAKLIWPIAEPVNRQYFQDFPFLYAFEIAGGNDLRGDYYEFGVWKGRSFVKAYKQAKLYFHRDTFRGMRFVAFDSFEGLPASNERFLPTGYGEGAFNASLRTFENACRRGGIPSHQLNIVKGFFSELSDEREDLRHLRGGKIAICYIDCDVFEGGRDALNFITDKLQTGSMLIIDDWNRHHAIPTAGLRRAVSEWLERNPRVRLTQIFLSKRVLFSVEILDEV
jgi:O-methyltransferase